MSETQDSINETMKKIIIKAQELKDQIGKIKEETKDIESYLDRLVDLMHDLKKIAKIQMNNAESYSSFKIVFNLNGSAEIHSPLANEFITEIDNECLMSKPIFSCLDEKFANKQEFYDKLLIEFLATFENYIERIKKYLPSLQRVEWIEKDIGMLNRAIDMLKERITKLEEEKDQCK
jgi:phage shock protein A